MNTQLVATKIDNKKPLDFKDLGGLSIGLPLLLGLVLGPLVAAAIVKISWVVALAILLLIPMAILLNRYPFATLMIWMATMPWFPFDQPHKYLYFAFHRILIPMGLGIVILERMLRLKKQRPARLGLADLATLAFGVAGVVSLILTQSQWKLIFSLEDEFLVPFMAYWLVRFSDAGEREVKRLMPLIVLLSLAQSAIGLASWFAPGSIPPIWDTGLLGDRIVGTLRQPAAYGCALTLFSVFIYHDAMHRPGGLKRTLEISVFGLGMVCLFFTFTRGVWVASLFTLLMLLGLYPKRTALLIAVVVALMSVLSAGPLAKEFAHAYDRLSHTEEGANDRLVQANAGKNMFYAKPVFGWGFASYDQHDWKFLERVQGISPTKWQIHDGTSHHTYLTILAEMGFVGLFFYAFPTLWWLAFTIKAVPKLPEEGFWSRRWLIAMWAPIGAHIMLAQDIDMRFFPYVLTLFWINLGFIANMAQTALEPNEMGD